MAYEIAVIGDLASVIAFRGLGFTVVTVDEGEEAQQELYRLIDSKNYAIIYITEPMAQASASILERYQDQVLPAIIPIPAAYNVGAYARTNLQRSVLRAVGFDVLAESDEVREQIRDDEENGETYGG